MALFPSLTGDTWVRIGPLGSLRLDTHDGPLGIVVDAREIRVEDARRFVERPQTLARVDDTAARDAQRAVRMVVLRGLLGGLAGSVFVVIVNGFSRRRALLSALGVVLATAVCGVVVRVTWDPGSIAEPQYSGLLTVAPQAVGRLQDVQERFEEYREQVSSLVTNLAVIYNTTANLPVLDDDEGEVIRLLHVSDLHLHPGAFDLIRELVRQFEIDAVVDTGDINDWGTVVETRFVDAIGELGVPYVFVRGNHDSSATAAAVASQPNSIVLDDDVADVEGIRIWGIGDPRFTPDKSEAVAIEEERRQATAFAPEVGRRLDRASPVDIAVLHDPRAAERLGGRAVPLVLAGHMHRPSSSDLDGTLLLVEGSTGGAGLRGLEGDEPVPLTATVLHVARDDKRLRAFDRISVSGLGRTGARIQRHLVATPDEGAAGQSMPCSTAYRISSCFRLR